MSLADQAMVSGANFLTTVIIGRFTFASELGLYSIAASLLISLFCIQESLITLPYTVQRHRPLGTPAEYAGSSMALSGLLSVLALLVLAAGALGMSMFGMKEEFAAVVWALAGVAPFALLRQLARQFAFAHLDVPKALILDTAASVVQLAALGWLAWTGWLTVTTALAAIGAACALVGLAWLLFERIHVAVRAEMLLRTACQSWNVGKWLFGIQLVMLMQAQVTYWIVASVAGLAATGIYAACVSVALLANPVVLGLSNTLCAKAALAFKDGDFAKLRRGLLQDTLMLGAAMALFCATIMLAGEDMLLLLYRGQEYAGHGHIVTVLALWQLAFAVGITAHNGLLTIGRARVSFWIGFTEAVLTTLLVWPLVAEWGVAGAAYGLLIGTAGRATARWIMFSCSPKRRLCSPGRLPNDTNPLRTGDDQYANGSCKAEAPVAG